MTHLTSLHFLIISCLSVVEDSSPVNTDAYVIDRLHMKLMDTDGHICRSERYHGMDNDIGWCMNRQARIDFNTRHCGSLPVCPQWEFRWDGVYYVAGVECWTPYQYLQADGGSLSLDSTPEDDENSEPCVDTPNWSMGETDSMGDDMNCEWFGKSVGRCDIYGQMQRGTGTANLNCCACQG